MKKESLFFLLLAFSPISPIHGQPAPAKPKTPILWQVIQNKNCGFMIRIPKGSAFEINKECVLKVTPPKIKGQEWIQQASLSLEVSAAKNGEATEKPVDGGAATGFLYAGGLKFEKTSEEDAAAGHRYVTVSYNAIGKKHQYHFVGILAATNPEMMGTPIPHWNAQKSAEKLFDGMVLNFKPIE